MTDKRTIERRVQHAHVNKRILDGVRAAIYALERGETQCAKMILMRVAVEQYAPGTKREGLT